MQVPWERPVGRRREAGGGTSWQPGGGGRSGAQSTLQGLPNFMCPKARGQAPNAPFHTNETGDCIRRAPQEVRWGHLGLTFSSWGLLPEG